MNTRARKAVGCFALTAYLTAYATVASEIGQFALTHAPMWIALLYFVVAGVIWVAPLRPIFAWMNGSGRHRS